MKVIKKEDLCILLPLIPDISFSIEEFEYLLNRYGDDYFIEDGEFAKFAENETMKSIREKHKSLS